MSVPGTMGKILVVDLNTQEISVETPGDDLYYDYLGGYGLGAYYLWKLQKPGVDPLGPDNLLGFFAGLLTGTAGITSNRYVVVAKSPKTGTFGDANSGGSFGPAMKGAGFDGVIFKGQSEKPVYLLLKDGQAELVPADDWWGLDSHDVEDKAQELYGKDARSACIGPAGERLSLLSCIINDKGRAAGRSGLGAVMGSKKVKAIVAVSGGEISMADPDGMKRAMKEHRDFMKQQGFYEVLNQYGTSGIAAAACASADTPIKNWTGSPDDFPTVTKISDDAVAVYRQKKWGCWKCPIACGGLMKVDDGPYASEGHRPEYETLGAFGTMCLNDDPASIILCNELCNRFGLDTISVGCTIAFALECYEKGLITTADTDGLELTWGNAAAIVELTRQIAQGTGFGARVLGNGMKAAAEQIGKGADEFAVHIEGEELPMHDPRLNPGLATSYKMDATPGRHTQMSAWTVEGEFCAAGLITEPFDKYKYTGKGEVHRTVSAHHHVNSAAGMCMFGWSVLKAECLTDSLTCVTGRKYTLADAQKIGDRIAALRMAFNVREGVRNIDFKIPPRMIGDPPLTAGPVAGVTVDIDTQIREYLEAMGWDTKTGAPTKETLERLGLDYVAAELAAM
ncbi:MAG: aldehyde ferredoxin oxidoreductase family protein [Candidatus Nealsonbacteria bacterium]|nr:aldehyde ferredoxin oxidoreductase family protein [Candidatus Nealsonbacteria bacterium]